MLDLKHTWAVNFNTFLMFNKSIRNKKTDLSIIPKEIILSKIYLLRDEKVMLDKDLALLYGAKPIRLREQVKRNISRFPENFMFQLSETETEIMVSQNAIPSKSHLGGTLPFAFTEHGVLMLANVLKSERAVKSSKHSCSQRQSFLDFSFFCLLIN